MLLRGEAFLSSRRFAESLEFPKLESKLGKRLVVYGLNFALCCWLRAGAARC